ncbi:MAG: type I restriction-modification system subunit M N-terminal domain-containing protein [Ruminococcus sp.]|nr:type I restriction-modification system subunit M N-terminal domain-containing protein [Ruminococcus sp.]
MGFEKQIWDAACVLWGHIPAAEYRKVIVGLIFLRYVGSAFEKRYNQLVADGDGFENELDAYLMDSIFFVPEKARWAVVSAAAHTLEIGSVIDDAMRSIEEENKTLKNVLPKNYASPDLDKRVLGDVVDLFTNMDMTETEDSKDLLGRTYEYCIAQFAAYEGVKGGEFYTPSSVVRTLVEILRPFENCRVYDTKPQAIKDFYENAELIAITKELAEKLRRNRTIDWQKRDSARAKMRMMIRKLLKDHRYPPEGMDDAVTTVMQQCELWVDNSYITEH